MGDRPDAVARFVWALRNSWGLCALAGLTFLALVVGAGMQLVGPTEYSARALVVPRSLGDDLDALRLSRFQQAVFENGGVIEAALLDDDVPYTGRTELLAHVELQPVEDNIALNVAATDGDPGRAAEVANAVAGYLVSALNRVGESVGTFQVHTPATPPAEPEGQLALTVLIAVGAVGGLATAVAVAALLATWRRPVLAPADAEEALDAPSLGRLLLPADPEAPVPLGYFPPPAARMGATPPIRVLGLSALVGRLYPRRSGTCVFVASEASSAAALQVASLVARALARQGPVLYVAGGDAQHTNGVPPDGRVTRCTAVEVAPEDWRRAPTVVEGPGIADVDLAEHMPLDASIVVVVTEGERAASLERLRQRFYTGGVAGVLFVQRERRPHRAARNRSATPELGPDVPRKPARVGEGAADEP
ncbi:hypothetical protein [Egicoccus sp. AB-alg2]|uniref:hypothetical protein n=1 Tax=Egicoccus sp. AB-alg2 TaxID=3242693 RepID=UPI00359E7F46